jgi:exosortase H (IPTLxxWG-CTERM-specific)
MGRFFFGFFLIQGVLFTLELLRPIQDAVIVPWTEFLARLSAWLVTAFDADVISYGKVLQDGTSGFAVSIEAGCNGVEAAIILTAAIVAFPASWSHRLWGLLAGVAAIQGLNLVRIISLFYLGQWNMTAFEWAHLYLWQALIMLDALIVFLIWIRLQPKRATDVL